MTEPIKLESIVIQPKTWVVVEWQAQHATLIKKFTTEKERWVIEELLAAGQDMMVMSGGVASEFFSPSALGADFAWPLMKPGDVFKIRVSNYSDSAGSFDCELHIDENLSAIQLTHRCAVAGCPEGFPLPQHGETDMQPGWTIAHWPWDNSFIFLCAAHRLGATPLLHAANEQVAGVRQSKA